mmetsp:Transcript_19478/g.25751  ORF Transcript_19478/g.25751 Transcript_19478/m.25751 type:complete len:226 (+) Transcript_19478:80-757(+)
MHARMKEFPVGDMLFWSVCRCVCFTNIRSDNITILPRIIDKTQKLHHYINYLPNASIRERISSLELVPNCVPNDPLALDNCCGILPCLSETFRVPLPAAVFPVADGCRPNAGATGAAPCAATAVYCCNKLTKVAACCCRCCACCCACNAFCKAVTTVRRGPTPPPEAAAPAPVTKFSIFDISSPPADAAASPLLAERSSPGVPARAARSRPAFAGAPPPSAASSE